MLWRRAHTCVQTRSSPVFLKASLTFSHVTFLRFYLRCIWAPFNIFVTCQAFSFRALTASESIGTTSNAFFFLLLWRISRPGELFYAWLVYYYFSPWFPTSTLFPPPALKPKPKEFSGISVHKKRERYSTATMTTSTRYGATNDKANEIPHLVRYSERRVAMKNWLTRWLTKTCFTQTPFLSPLFLELHYYPKCKIFSSVCSYRSPLYIAEVAVILTLSEAYAPWLLRSGFVRASFQLRYVACVFFCVCFLGGRVYLFIWQSYKRH